MRLHAALLTAALLALVPAAAQAAPGPYVASPNVEFLKNIPFDVGQTAGGKVVGDRLFVTSAKNLSVYDISTPEDPQLMGLLNINLAWENEEVPTNGKILGVSSDFFSLMPSCATTLDVTSCLQLFDVRDPENIRELPPVPQNGDHTNACALDCSFLYGSAGSVTDLRGVLDGGAAPRDLGDWRTAIREQGVNPQSCHHVREIRSGVMFAACQPYVLFSVDPADAARPTLLASGGNTDGRFVHSVRWPRGGADRFAFQGGETNFNPQCGDDLAAFSVIDASETAETGVFGPVIDEVRMRNGTYADGNVPVNATGCSVHWFEEHPSFHNGGLVALAAYDNGTRFMEVAPDGKLTEQGYYQPLGNAQTSSPKWVPGTDIVYSIDYTRGIDVLRWTGKHYVPGSAGRRRDRKRPAGTRGRQPLLPAVTAAQRAVAAKTVSVMRQRGWRPGYCALIASRSG